VYQKGGKPKNYDAIVSFFAIYVTTSHWRKI